MKTKISRKDAQNICDYVFVGSIPQIHDIMRGNGPKYYNCGKYGWNWDLCTIPYVLIEGDNGLWVTRYTVGIMTGYRNTTGIQIPHELEKRFQRRAAEIEDWYDEHFREDGSYEHYQARYENLRDNFAFALINFARGKGKYSA